MHIRRSLWLVLLSITIAGCAGNLKLIEDGKIHYGSYDQLSKTLQVSINGVLYKGTYSQGVSLSTGGVAVGSQIATGFSTTTDGSGQALLLSPDGKVLRCRFGSVVAWRGQGQCTSNDGRLYDLLIGQ